MTCCIVTIKRIVENFQMEKWMKLKQNRNESEIETPAPGRSIAQQCGMIAFLWSHLFQFGALCSLSSLIIEWLIVCPQLHRRSIVYLVYGHANFIEMFRIRNNSNLAAWVSFDCTTPRCMHFVLIMQIQWIACTKCGYICFYLHTGRACSCVVIVFVIIYLFVFGWIQKRLSYGSELKQSTPKIIIHVDLMQNQKFPDNWPINIDT